ncbi:MAG: hypothetical protein ACRED3_17380, partial [Bradyrhizobium sp.]
ALTDRLNQQIQSIETNQDLELTPAAKELIFLAINAIETDPLPYRLQAEVSLAQCQGLAIEHLPRLLAVFVIARNKGKKIGALDLLEFAPQLMSNYLAFRMPT